MKFIKISKYLIFTMITCLILFSSSIYSYSPTQEFFVNDFANILSSDIETEVYNSGVEIQKTTTAQLVVVTVPSLDGKDIEGYANELYNKWGIGDKEKSNGVLLLISKDDRKIRIEVGYGLEGALNDAKTGRILDDVAIPSLKNNDYNTAVKNVVVELKGIIYNEYGVEGGFDNYAKAKFNFGSLISIIIGIIVVIAIFSGRGGGGMFLLGTILGGRGGFGGGSSGGGFGGFSGGGGSSGGGGASRGF